MPNQLKALDVEFVSLVDRAAVRNAETPSEPQRFLVWKRETPPPEGGQTMPEIDEVRADLEKAERDRDEANAALQKAQDDLKALTDKVAELEKSSPEPATINKDELSPVVREALEKAEADRVALAKRAEEAERIAKEERDTRITREFVTKAEGYSNLSVDATVFGPVLKAASETLSGEQFEALESVLKSADEAVRAGNLFKEQGQGGTPVRESDAYSEAVRKADELRKSDSGISRQEALSRAFRNDPALQERYLAEVR
jgi:hypothetical protein